MFIITEELKNSFAHYDERDIYAALMATNKLFDKLTREIAVCVGIEYPSEAAACAKKHLES